MGDIVGTKACLERALRHFSRLDALRLGTNRVLYSQAKCYALLGRAVDVLRIFEVLSDKDRRYLSLAREDDDFHSLMPEIENVFKSALHSPGPSCHEAIGRLTRIEEALDWIQKADRTIRSDVIAGSNYWRSASEQLRSTHVNIEETNARLKELTVELENIGVQLYERPIIVINEQIVSLRRRQSHCERSINSTKDDMKATSAGAPGCIAGVISFFIGAAIFSSYRPFLIELFGLQRENFGMIALSLLAVGIAGGSVTAGFVRYIKNTPKRESSIRNSTEIPWDTQSNSAARSTIG